jgi:methionyl-tRNA formyltransferase
VGVLTQPDRPKGRGRQITAGPVKAAALAHGIAVAQPLSLKDPAGRAELETWRPDVLVVVAYGLILPPAVLGLPRLGCINIHGSLLPRWRGAAPIQRAILAGDSCTGITIMLMDVGLDTGPMLLKQEIPIESTDTGGSIHDRLSVSGASALLEALESYSAGTLKPIPQPAEGVTYASKIEKSEALLDWHRDALELDRQVRAFNPWPVAETRLEGEQLRIFGAAVLEGLSSTEIGTEPGTITAVSDSGVVVQCGRGQLALQQLQRPGRRAVPAADFIRGMPLTGRRLG